MSDRFSIIKSNKGAQHIVIDNYRHRKYRKVGETTYWRCVNENCNGRFKLIDNLIHDASEHSHEPDTFQLNQLMQANKAKEIASSATFIKVKQTYDEATQYTIGQTGQAKEVIAPSLKTFEQLRKTINRARTKKFPPLPQAIEQIEMPSTLLSSSNGLFYRSNANQMLIFVTNAFLGYLCAAEHIYADGTFKSVPRLFQSLYTLHVMIDSQMTPVVYVLLPDSTLPTYINLFRNIQDLCMQLDLVWSPKKFTTDFELAVIKAIQITFPSCEIKCCLFHFSQSLWRNVGKYGLIQRYRSESDGVQFTVKRLSALPFLKISDIPSCYVWIKAQAPTDENMLAYFDYFERTYLNNDSRFPLTIWNHFKDSDPRTNNHVEGWHSVFNRAVGRNHANLWIFTENLIKQQNANEVKVLISNCGAQMHTGSRKYADINCRIMNITLKYEAGTITPQNCVDTLKYYTRLTDLN